jgi:CheY-like chemotaxis protein
MTLSDALAAAHTEAIDIALLDVNLHGEKVYPVAEVLTNRNIPFLFLSGYGRDAIPSDQPEWRVCSKPFRPDDLMKSLAGIMQSHQARCLTSPSGAI